MKKLIFTMILVLGCIKIALPQTTILDPAEYEGETLPSGWSVVDVNGEKYMQVITNGWNTFLNIPEITEFPNTTLHCTFKYALGPATDDSLSLADFIAVVRIIDTVNKVPADWDPSTLVPAQTAMTQNPATGIYEDVIGEIPTEMELGHILQVSGQETTSWTPSIGDTIWFSKITTPEVSVDSHVVFNPATYPDANLPSNMEKVIIGSDTLIKITTVGWDNYLDLESVFEMGDLNCLNFKIMIDPGTTGHPLSDLRYFIAGNDPVTQVFTFTDSAVGTLTQNSIITTTEISVSSLQFAVQNTSDWSAEIGAIYYLSKITATKNKIPNHAPRVIYTVLHTNGETITMDGLTLEDVWQEADTAKADQPVSFIDGMPASDTDNSANWYAAYDRDFLYLYFDITDDVIVPMTDPDGEVAQVWMNDGIEIFLDYKDRRYDLHRISSEQHQIRFNIDRSSADTSAFNGYECSWEQVKGVSDYQFEIALPWRGIAQGSISSDDVDSTVNTDILPGKTISFEISIIDADIEDIRKSNLNWSNNTGEDMAYNTSLYYGQLILGEMEGVGITSYPITNAIQNEPYSYQLNYYGSGDFSLTSTPAAGWLTIDENGLLNGTPPSAGNYDISILLDDGTYQATQNFTLEVEPFSYTSNAVFDPATYPPGNLPSNMEIVVIDSDTLLKVTTNSPDAWDNFLPLLANYNMEEDNTLSFKLMIDPGSSGKLLSEMDYFIAGENDFGAQVFATDASAESALTDITIDVTPGIDISTLQFAVKQNYSPWPALSNVIYYIGKVTSSEVIVSSLPPATNYVVANTDETIVIDGADSDNAWSETAFAEASETVAYIEGNPTSKSDNSATWHALYDMENLYLFVNIIDDVIVPMSDPDSPSASPWLNDGIELYIDIRDRRMINKRINSQQHQLRFNVDRSTADMDGLGAYQATWGQVKTDTSYQLEFSIPWRGICQGAMVNDDVTTYINDSIKAGKNIAFEMSIIDADTEDVRKSALNWSNNTGRDTAYHTSEFYGQLSLAEANDVGIVSTPPIKALESIPYNYQLNFYGAGTFSVTTEPEVNWLTIDNNGLLTGTPTSAGEYEVTISLANSEKVTNQSFTLIVDPYTPVNISSAPVDTGLTNILYEYQVLFEGEGEFSLTTTPEAEWLTIDQNGLLSGTPSTEAETSITITLADSASVTTQSFNLVIDSYTVNKITSAPVLTGNKGEVYEYQLTFEGEGEFSVFTIPTVEWLAIDHNGLLSGIPDAVGSLNISVSLDDGISSDEQKFTMLIADGSATERNIQDDIFLYPNPVSNVVYIKNANGASVNIYDLTGKTLETYSIDSDNYLINVQDLEKGSYLVLIKIDNNKTSKLLLIE